MKKTDHARDAEIYCFDALSLGDNVDITVGLIQELQKSFQSQNMAVNHVQFCFWTNSGEDVPDNAKVYHLTGGSASLLAGMIASFCRPARFGNQICDYEKMKLKNGTVDNKDPTLFLDMKKMNFQQIIYRRYLRM